MTIVEQAFVVLRGEWFNTKLKKYPHEREWENEEQELNRKNYNKNLAKIFDKQTYEILQGLDRPIAPNYPEQMEINDE